MTTSPRRVLWAALALAAALGLVDCAAAARGAQGVRGAVSIAEALLGAVACLAAAAAFGRGDHQKRAWTLLGLGFVAFAGLYAGNVLLVPDSAIPTWYYPTLTLVTNLLRLAGTAQLAATWRRTGLPEPGSPSSRWAIRALLLAGIAAVVGPDLWHYTAKAAHGDAYAAVLALADVSDAAVLMMVAPLLRTALALAGGSLAWPFALMAASNGCWLLFDGLAVYAEAAGASPLQVKQASAILFALGCLLFAAAGVTQRQALRAAARGAARA